MKLLQSVTAILRKVIIAAIIPLLLISIILIAAPDQFSIKIFGDLVQLGIAPAILAYGMFFSLTVGLWNFSVGAFVLISAIVGGNLSLMLGWGVIGAAVLCPIIGLIVGYITGIIFRLTKIPSIVVSIGVLLIIESISTLIFGGFGVSMPDTIYVIGRFPTNVILMIIASATAYYLFTLSKFGYHVRAVGNGIMLAKARGINVDNIRVLVFMVSGGFAGLYALMQLGFSRVTIPAMNMQSMAPVFDAIICVFIARALKGSVHSALGIIIGAVSVQLIKYGIVVTKFPSIFQQVVIAIFLLLFIATSSRGKDVKDAVLRLFSKKKDIELNQI